MHPPISLQFFAEVLTETCSTVYNSVDLGFLTTPYPQYDEMGDIIAERVFERAFNFG